MPRIIVVGAGIAGLSAAWFLRDHDVTLVDGAPTAGGKLRTSDIAGLPVDEGAEQLLVRRPEAVTLAREVGLGDDLVHPATSNASIWARDALRPLPPRSLLGVPSTSRSLASVLSPVHVARAAVDYVLPGEAPVDDISVAAYVGGRLGHAVVDTLVEPLLGGVYAGRADHLSLHATMPQLPKVDGSLMRAVRRAVPPPSGEPVFAAVRGGLQRLADAVLAESGAALVTGRAVRRIERTLTGWRVVHGATVDEQALDADAVVVAVPATPAARLLAEHAPAAAQALDDIDYASVAVVTLAFAESAPLPGSGYLVPVTAGRPVKAVTFSSTKWEHLRAAVIVRASIGRYGDVTDLQRDDDELVQLVRAELRLTTGLDADPIASRVTRWGGGLPQYTVGHLERVRRIRESLAGLPGIAVCGAAYDGIGVPACIASARLAAEHLRTSFATAG